MKLLAVDTKTAAHRWEKELEKQSMYTLGVADGTVYAKQERKYSSDPEEREIRAFDAATGTELWSVEESGSNLKPTDDVVLYESSSGIVSRSATDGRVEWTHEPAESIRSSVVADESVYVARTDDTLEVLSLEDGEKESQQLLDTAEATLVAGGTTLYLRRPDSLSAIDLETGEAKWTNEFDRAITDQFEANELVASADTAYLARSKEGDEDDNHRNTIYAFDADTGNERWRTESAHGYYPFVGADNGLYTITSEDRLLVRRDRDSGEVLSERQVTKGFIDHLVVTGDAVYVTSNNGMEPNSAVHVYRADSESDSGEDDDSDDRQDDESSDETDGSDDSEDSDDSEESDDSNDDC